MSYTKKYRKCCSYEWWMLCETCVYINIYIYIDSNPINHDLSYTLTYEYNLI